MLIKTKSVSETCYKQEKLILRENLKSIEKELNKAFISENIDMPFNKIDKTRNKLVAKITCYTVL